MKDCSHHITSKDSAWDMFVRFMQSSHGQEWYAKYVQAKHASEPEPGCFKMEEW